MGPLLNCVCVCSYPELKPIQSINAHPSNCICIKFDPTGKYFATGSADALVSLWDVEELVCVRCFSRSVCVWHDNIIVLESVLCIDCGFHHRLDWPVRTLSFSHDGKMLASASEDHFIDIAEVETGQYKKPLAAASQLSVFHYSDWKFGLWELFYFSLTKQIKESCHHLLLPFIWFYIKGIRHLFQERNFGRCSVTLPRSLSPGTPRGHCWPTPVTTKRANMTTTGRQALSNCLAFPMTPEMDQLIGSMSQT